MGIVLLPNHSVQEQQNRSVTPKQGRTIQASFHLLAQSQMFYYLCDAQANPSRLAVFQESISPLEFPHCIFPASVVMYRSSGSLARQLQLKEQGPSS